MFTKMNRIKFLLFLFFLLTHCFPINAQEYIDLLDTQDSDFINRVTSFGKRFIESEDKKLRLFSAPVEDKYGWHYGHTIEYDIAPGKVRTTNLYDSRFFSFSAFDFPELIIDTIYHVHKDIYLLEGVTGNEYCLLGVDIGRGIARDAYVFQNWDTDEAISCISVLVDTAKYAIEDVKVKFSGNSIRLPKWGDDAFSADYVYQYFNCVHYENSISYSETAPKVEEGRAIITRIYFKDEDNRLKQDALYSFQTYSVVVDVAAQNGEFTSPLHLSLENQGESEHFQGKFYNVKMALKLINGATFVEGLNSYYFPIISQRKFLRGGLRSVVYTAGRESAFPYECLRYTAVIFNRPIKDKERSRVRWALEVDGKLQLLEGENWQGPQIDLQMRDEWLHKKILVIPYIEGNPINYKVAIETTIIPY